MPDKTFLDWPFFDAAHREWAEQLNTWCRDHLDPMLADQHNAAGSNDELDQLTRSLVATLGRAGWLKPCVPAEYGGAESGRLDVRRLCLTRETLARYAGLADFAFAMQGLGTGSITLFGSDLQRQYYLPPVLAGERVAAFAISEPDAGSDPAAMITRAHREGDEYRINGTKTWISNAGVADHYVLFARTGAAGAGGISAFVVAADTPGLEISERIDVIAPHPLGTVTLTDCRIPAGQRLGEEGEGFKIAMATLDIFRSTVAAAALGFARRALDEALSRSEARQIGGQPLADYQITQAKLADMAVKIDAAALLVYRAAWTKDVLGQRVGREAAMAKYYATEAAQEVIDQAVQIHGGLGVVSGETVERLYREIRALRIYEGTSEIQQLIIAGQTRRAREERVMDHFIRDNLPPAELWPERDFSGVPELNYPERLNCVNELLDRWITAGRGDAPVLHFGDTTWGYADLQAKVNRIAHVLVEDLGVEPGNRVLLRAPTIPCWSPPGWPRPKPARSSWRPCRCCAITSWPTSSKRHRCTSRCAMWRLSPNWPPPNKRRNNSARSSPSPMTAPATNHWKRP